LEIGTGPTIHTIIAASEHVQSIFLSDYAVQNRQILCNWLEGKRDLDLLSFEYLQSQHCLV